jgi:fumarate reductase subunit C
VGLLELFAKFNKKHFLCLVKKYFMQKTEKNPFPFEKANYMIMIFGLILLLLGFIIMASDKEQYGFGFLGITLGPIVLLLGFLTQFLAIFYKPKK